MTQQQRIAELERALTDAILALEDFYQSGQQADARLIAWMRGQIANARAVIAKLEG